MPTWIAVAAGGAAGTLARYLIGSVWTRAGAFPWPTLGINVIGSLALGAIVGAAMVRGSASSTLTIALAVGVAGGFTTFSTFSVETLAMIERGESLRAAAYVTASVLLGLLAAALGVYLTRTRIVA